MEHIRQRINRIAYTTDSGLVESFRQGIESVKELGVQPDPQFIKRESVRFKNRIQRPRALTQEEFWQVRGLIAEAGWEIVNGYYRWEDGIVENGSPLGRIEIRGDRWLFRWLSDDEIEDLLWEEAGIMGYDSPRELESTVLEAESTFPHYETRKPSQKWQPIDAVLAAS